MNEKDHKTIKSEATQHKPKYIPPETVKHEPIDIVCGTCATSNECSLYYSY